MGLITPASMRVFSNAYIS